MEMKNKLALYVLSLSLFFTLASVTQVREKPNPPHLVNDFTGVLSADFVQSLERDLIAYQDSTSNQICVVFEKTTGDLDIFSYSHELFVKWGIGEKGKDNGVLLFVAVDDRRNYIIVGKGLEPVLTDADCGHIVDRIIMPAFKAQHYEEGVRNAVMAMIGYIGGEFHDKPKLNPQYSNDSIIIPLLIFALFVGFAFYSNYRTERRIRSTMLKYGITYLAARTLLGLDRPSRPSGGGWGGFTGWGGGFGGGGGGGGGFGGFGGGDSGGGGAGGSW
jgi:uncharacterized protein